MKNNKKFNRTFQLSLVATILSLANLGWAMDLTCNTTTGCKYIQGPAIRGISTIQRLNSPML